MSNFEIICSDSTKPCKFVIGNGGAGITGFLQYMVTAFLQREMADYCVAWKTSDTEETLNGLKDGLLDVGWPYDIERVCEAHEEGIGSKPVYIFRDHFSLVGPLSNPGCLPAPEKDPTPHYPNQEVCKLFAKIASGKEGVYFLTRNDKSATNVREQKIFKEVLGRCPDPKKDSWYIPLQGSEHYPDSALKEANEKGYYTLTDRGIWNWAEPEIRKNLRVFCEAGDCDSQDILLNPCLAMVKANGTPPEAVRFVEWLASSSGQELVEQYKQYGERLYSKAPEPDLHPCDS